MAGKPQVRNRVANNLFTHRFGTVSCYQSQVFEESDKHSFTGAPILRAAAPHGVPINSLDQIGRATFICEKSIAILRTELGGKFQAKFTLRFDLLNLDAQLRKCPDGASFPFAPAAALIPSRALRR
jgi:hypothetical protein